VYPFCRRRARSPARQRAAISRKSTPVVLHPESPIKLASTHLFASRRSQCPISSATIFIANAMLHQTNWTFAADPISI
jgi:hypothetical protein